MSHLIEYTIASPMRSYSKIYSNNHKVSKPIIVVGYKKKSGAAALCVHAVTYDCTPCLDLSCDLLILLIVSNTHDHPQISVDELLGRMLPPCTWMGSCEKCPLYVDSSVNWPLLIPMSRNWRSIEHPVNKHLSHTLKLEYLAFLKKWI